MDGNYCQSIAILAQTWLERSPVWPLPRCALDGVGSPPALHHVVRSPEQQEGTFENVSAQVCLQGAMHPSETVCETVHIKRPIGC